MKKIGIYKITNLKNGKIYIGQSINILERFTQHKSDLKGNRHSNKHLQSAYNLYGLETFKFEILEECSKKQLDKRERYWINFFGGVSSKTNYNQKDGGHCKCKFSEESIFVMKKIKKGKHFGSKSEFKKGMIPWNKGKVGTYVSNRRKKIYQYDLDGNFIAEYNSALEASKSINVSSSLISLCCLKKHISHQFQWRYEKHKKISKAKIKQRTKKKVYQYDLDGNFVAEYESAAEAAKKIGTSASIIQACCLKYKNNILCKGFQWRHFLRNNGIEKARSKNMSSKYKKTVLQYDAKGNFIKEYCSIKQVENDLKYAHCSISRCCNYNENHEEKKKAYGYIWIFKNKKRVAFLRKR